MNPSQGRWLSPDPAEAGWNLYAYGTDPNGATDPSGLQMCCWGADKNGQVAFGMAGLGGTFQIAESSVPANSSSNAPNPGRASPDPDCKYLCWWQIATNWLAGNGAKTNAEVRHEVAETNRNYLVNERGFDRDQLNQMSDRQVIDLMKAFEGGESSFVSEGVKFILTAAATVGRFASETQLQEHFRDHGGDFGTKTPAEYQQKADTFLNGPRGSGVLEKVRANGDVVRYNPGTEEFGVAKGDGAIRTYFKPDPAVHGFASNLDYFNAQ